MTRRVHRAIAMRIVAAVSLAAIFVAPTSAAGATLTQRVEAAIRSSSVAGSTAVYVWDQQTRNVLVARSANQRVAPASTLKLLTSAAALARMGPTHRFSTRVKLIGHQAGNRWIGDVWLVGGGDPSLSTFGFARDNFRGQGANLASLVAPLRARGIEGIAGRIMVDDTRFDSLRWVPEWKPSFRLDESGALGALTANESLVGRYIGSRSSSRPNIRAGQVYRDLLRRQGIFVSRETAAGTVPASAEEVGKVDSPPLSTLLRQLNQTSDNFYAEMLLKNVGVHRFGTTGDGSTKDGRRAARTTLANLGINMNSVEWVDGSGLAYGSRVTARTLGHVLGVGAQAPWGTQWIDSFPRSGISGTLRRRMTRWPYRGRVAAKTGTLQHVSALAGFSTRLSGRRYGFVVVTYNAAGRQISYTAARNLQDRIAKILVR